MLDEHIAFCEDIAALMGPDRACHYLRKFHSWYLAGRGIDDADIQALMEDPTFDEAVARLLSLRERARIAGT